MNDPAMISRTGACTAKAATTYVQSMEKPNCAPICE